MNREDQILIEEYQALNANVTSRGQETGTYVTTGIIGAVLIGTAALASLGLSGPILTRFQ